MKLIDKDTLIGEVNRLKSEALQKKSRCKKSGLEKIMYQISAYNKILSFLNTLEVKEVDIKNEVINFMSSDEYQLGKESGCIIVAKHFFELGLKVQKGE